MEKKSCSFSICDGSGSVELKPGEETMLKRALHYIHIRSDRLKVLENGDTLTIPCLCSVVVGS